MNNKYVFDIEKIKIIFATALFSFLFLGTEYLFDDMMAYVTDSDQVVIAQSFILGASVVGFLLYPVLSRKVSERLRDIGIFTSAIACIICVFVIWQHSSYLTVLVSGLICFLIAGIGGSFVYYNGALIIGRDRHLAAYMGISYGLGIMLQFVNNNLVNNDMVESVVLAITIMLYALLLFVLSRKETNVPGQYPDESYVTNPKTCDISQSLGGFTLNEPVNPRMAGIALVICVVLMSCIFSTLDVEVTRYHAAGEVDIGQWPRMILALSGICAGYLYDICNRRYMTIMMYCVTILSAISIVVIELGGPFIWGLVTFYFSAGFFVVFFTTAFVQLSIYMKNPRLWAGLGRALNNVCAFTTSAIAVALFNAGAIALFVVVLIIFMVISIVGFIYLVQCSQIPSLSKRMHEPVELQDDERFDAFVKEYGITDREAEVLKFLLESDENVQDIAVDLSISRAALYRHIASLNEKTDTRTRIGLLQLYYTWK